MSKMFYLPLKFISTYRVDVCDTEEGRQRMTRKATWMMRLNIWLKWGAIEDVLQQIAK